MIMTKTLKLAVFLVLAYGLVPLALGHNPYVVGLIVASLTIGGIAIAWALLGNLGDRKSVV